MTNPTEEGATGDVPGFGPCYRHADRDSGVRCARCERPICPRCMITASVGFQCPECVKGAPAVRTLRSLTSDPYATWTIIALNVAVFLPSIGSGGAALGRSANRLTADFALFGPAVADGEWWRLVTSGFLHYGLWHLGFNMLLLYQLGRLLEPSLGRSRFVALYVTALLAGSLGALVDAPEALTAGASGAVFGLMAAAFISMRRRGIDPMQSGLGGLLVINLLLTFFVPGISKGGHIGGLVGGALAAWMLAALDDLRLPAWTGVLACAVLSAGLVVASMAVASDPPF